MDTENFVSTRQALHAVAELLLAGPAYVSDADIRLRATTGGFGVWRQPGPRVDGTDLVIGDRRIALVGTIASVAEAAEVTPRALADVYADVVATPVDAPCGVRGAAAELATAFDHGNKALLAFAPDVEAVSGPSISTSGSRSPRRRSTTASLPAIRSSRRPTPMSARGRCRPEPSGPSRSARPGPCPN